MIDTQAVISQVMQGNYPSHWRIYLGQAYSGCVLFWWPSQSFRLVILPDGAVQWEVDNPQSVSWLYFPNIIRLVLAQQSEIVGMDGDISTNTWYWLDVYSSDGTYLKWGIGNFFGDAAAIGKTIIAAYEYYWDSQRLFPQR